MAEAIAGGGVLNPPARSTCLLACETHDSWLAGYGESSMFREPIAGRRGLSDLAGSERLTLVSDCISRRRFCYWECHGRH
jgi:hypothetical protein